MPSSDINKPIYDVKKTTDDILQLIKNMRVDMSIIRADIKIIKEKLEEKEKVEKMSGGWWIY
jgi:glycerol-3-phosphate dehydrogenase